MRDEQQPSQEIEALRAQIGEEALRLRMQELSRLFDLLSRTVSESTGELRSLLDAIKRERDETLRMRLLRRLLVTGTCVKRRCNLLLMEQAAETIDAAELQMAFKELVNVLTRTGLYAAQTVDAAGEVPPRYAAACLELFEAVMREDLFRLNGVMITMKKTPEALRFLLQLDYHESTGLSYLKPLADRVTAENDLFGTMELTYGSDRTEGSVTLRYCYE